jgi:hypothetical protein
VAVSGVAQGNPLHSAFDEIQNRFSKIPIALLTWPLELLVIVLEACDVEHSWKIQETFMEDSGKIQRTFRER